MAAPALPQSAASETVGPTAVRGVCSRTIARTVMALRRPSPVCALFALVFYFVVDQRAARDLEGECEASSMSSTRSSDAHRRWRCSKAMRWWPLRYACDADRWTARCLRQPRRCGAARKPRAAPRSSSHGDGRGRFGPYSARWARRRSITASG
ncbi:MAG: hypothetical protein ACLT98_14605 [Eggerthellaceae bacterium]